VPLAIDPTGQLHGWRAAATAIETAAAARGAATVGTVSYTTTAHLRFYGSRTVPVVQLGERLRYAMEPPPDIDMLRSRSILVAVESRRETEALAALRATFRSVQRAGSVERHWVPRFWRSGYVDTLALFLVAEPLREGFPDIGTQ